MRVKESEKKLSLSSGYEVLTRFFLAFDTWFVLLLNPLVNHDLSYRHFKKCSASFGHTIMRHCQTYIHIQINACHVHLGFAQLDKAFEPRKKARTGGSSTWAMGCNLNQFDTTWCVSINIDFWMWKLNDKQMFNHSLDSAGGPFHPSTFKSIHDIKHYQTISSTFDYINDPSARPFAKKSLRRAKASQRPMRHQL